MVNVLVITSVLLFICFQHRECNVQLLLTKSTRVITGQNMFVTDYINRGTQTSKVGLGTDVPSKIIRLPLADYGGSVICQRGAFLAGSHTIDIQVC